MAKGSKLILAALFVFPLLAVAHEETCSFTGKLKNIRVSEKRSPQAEMALVVADVEISEAKSQDGTLSYLDCKHWQNESVSSVEILVNRATVAKLKSDSTVKVNFSRRGQGEHESVLWSIAGS